jgi:hypothetical protein
MASAAWAQATPADTAAPPPPTPPAAVETPPPPPAPPTPPPAAPPPAVATTPPPTPTPPTAAEAMPATRPDVLPPIDVGAWLRVSGKFQKPTDPKSIGDWSMGDAYVELHAGGKIHKNVGVTLNLNANMLAWNGSGVPSQGSLVAVEDAIVSFDFADEFHLWAGHLLVPVDRANSAGPFFMIPWNYPGVAVAFAIPKEGPSGRNNGAVVWGDFAGGKFTYLVGVFDNGDGGTSSPLFSGRLRLSLLDPEGGFWGNASYFGDKDIFTIGVGGQVQAHGSQITDPTTMVTTDKTYSEVNADVLLEKKTGGGSYFTAEGAYYHYGVEPGNPSDSLYILAAYASPVVGVGNLQPMVRYQWAKIKEGTGSNPWNIDAALSYLIKGPALRVNLTYSHSKAGDASANAVQLGAQAIFF